MTAPEEIITGLRQNGYRITPQRELIIRAISESGRHMPVEEIFVQVQKHTSSIKLATIYRTLDMLWEEGYVHRNDLNVGKKTYAIFEHGPHVHLVCRHCNKIIDVNPEVVKPLHESLKRQHGFNADLEHLSLFGVCHDCLDLYEED